jgi:hypothetical protein
MPRRRPTIVTTAVNHAAALHAPHAVETARSTRRALRYGLPAALSRVNGLLDRVLSLDSSLTQLWSIQAYPTRK